MEATVKATKKRMKRKDLDQVNDDFSDFWLSSPAQKIRRLVLPPSLSEFFCLVYGFTEDLSGADRVGFMFL